MSPKKPSKKPLWFGDVALKPRQNAEPDLFPLRRNGGFLRRLEAGTWKAEPEKRGQFHEANEPKVPGTL